MYSAMPVTFINSWLPFPKKFAFFITLSTRQSNLWKGKIKLTMIGQNMQSAGNKSRFRMREGGFVSTWPIIKKFMPCRHIVSWFKIPKCQSSRECDRRYHYIVSLLILSWGISKWEYYFERNSFKDHCYFFVFCHILPRSCHLQHHWIVMVRISQGRIHKLRTVNSFWHDHIGVPAAFSSVALPRSWLEFWIQYFGNIIIISDSVIEDYMLV